MMQMSRPPRETEVMMMTEMMMTTEKKAEIEGRLHGFVDESDNGREIAEERKGLDSSRDEGLLLRNEITSTTPSRRQITRSMMTALQKEISLRSDSASVDETQQDHLEENDEMIHHKSSLITDNTTARTTPTTNTSIDNSLHTFPSDDDTFPDFTDFNDPYIPTNDARGIPFPSSQPTKAVVATRHPHSSSPRQLDISTFATQNTHGLRRLPQDTDGKLITTAPYDYTCYEHLITMIKPKALMSTSYKRPG